MDCYQNEALILTIPPYPPFAQGGKKQRSPRYAILSFNSVLLIGKASLEPADDPRVLVTKKVGLSKLKPT